jgi:hypothetical protein
MIEVTLGKNLVVSERPTFPFLHPLKDLTEDLPAARTVITAARRFFWLDTRHTSFSGFARKLDRFDGDPGPFGPCFYVQLWENNVLLRTVAFRNIGYIGILHIELPTGEKPFEEDADSNDLIGAMCKDVPGVPETYAREVIGYVDEGRLELTLPYVASY